MRLSEIALSGNFLRIIELFPPALPLHSKSTSRHDLSTRFQTLADAIRKLEPLADGFSLPELRDGTRIHLNSVAVASELKRQTGDLVIPTLTLRDSNRQSLLGQIAFSIFSGIQNIFVVRGDPYSGSADPKNVFDFRKVSDLVSAVRNLESSTNQEKLCILSPIRITRSADPDYLETMRIRQESGVDIFVAESFFDDFESYFLRVEDFRSAGIKQPIVHTIFPLKSYDDAIACIQKFGWNIPQEELNGLKERGNDYGVEMAKNRYFALLEKRKLADGVSISTRGNSEIVNLILS